MKIAAAMRDALTLAALFVLVLPGAQRATAQTETVLYRFKGSSDGGNPAFGTPAMDKDGNLYGTTYYGGTNNLGTVWKLSASGTETILWNFGSGADGATPVGLVMDKKGNLYGITYSGGAYNLGTAYELTPSGTETVLWSFGNGQDGSAPQAIIRDDEGNLYGTALNGGSYNLGTVWKLSPSGTETVLWNFGTISTDQGHPQGLMLASNGNLYGTDYGLNGNPETYGQVWEVTGPGQETDLYTFSPLPLGKHGFYKDGGYPGANMVMDENGNLYGTCHFFGRNVVGTVFKLTPTGKETTLHNFTRKDDGAEPYSNTVMDKRGNLYSVAAFGGLHGGGSVWKMTRSGQETVLHSFTAGGHDGYMPFTGVVLDTAGNIYGTTVAGGKGDCKFGTFSGCGTVFKITP